MCNLVSLLSSLLGALLGGLIGWLVKKRELKYSQRLEIVKNVYGNLWVSLRSAKFLIFLALWIYPECSRFYLEGYNGEL